MPRYIQINEEGYIVSDSRLSGEVDDRLMIPVDSDFQCGNVKYDFETGEWVEYIPEPTPEPEPELTEAELVQAEILLNQAEILAKQNEQDEVLAEILLNQMGV